MTCNGSGFPINNNPSINFTQGFPNQATTDDVVGKVDYVFNQRHSISGTYFFGNNSGTVEDFPETAEPVAVEDTYSSPSRCGNWIWTPNARWVNEARVGYNRLYQPTLPGDLNTPASSYGLTTGVSGPFTGGLPRIGFAGAFVPGLGAFKWPKFQGPDSITQFIDHVSYTVGTHSLNSRRTASRPGFRRAFGNARGSITFLNGVALANSTALEDFMAGDPFKASVQVGDPTRQIHDWAYALFFQDDWRVRKNLTFNYGVRYEFSSVIKEAHNRLANFNPNSPTGVSQVGINGFGSPYNSDPKDFGPRFGFAWDITGKGNTVVRGGASLMYETVNWESFLAFNNSYGLTNIPTGAIIAKTGAGNQQTAGGTITAGNLLIPPFLPQWDSGQKLYGDLSSSQINCDPNFANPCPIMSVAHNLTTPYIWSWTLNVQHAFTPNLSLELGYVGNHGTNLTGIRDVNQETPGADAGAGGYSAFQRAVRLVKQHLPNGQYLQVELQRPADDIHWPQLSRISSSRDTHTPTRSTTWVRTGTLATGTASRKTNVVPQREYASSDFDMRHRLTLSMTYAIPGIKTPAQLLQGWQLNTHCDFK